MDRKSERGADADLLVSLVNGRPSATLGLFDRAASYGDGLYETVALIDGQPQHWRRHHRRLIAGCARLFIDCPAEDIWLADLEQARQRYVLPPRAVLKLILSRGESRRGYAPDQDLVATRILVLSEWPGIEADDADFVAVDCATRLGLNPALAGIKHLNRLEQVLGAREVALAGANEGLMLDQNDRVIAGTRSNVFIVLDDHRILTPTIHASGVAGIMREIVLEEASTCGLSIEEGAIKYTQLANAAEFFFTNSLRGIQPATLYSTEGRTKPLATQVGRDLRLHFQQRGLMP
jgi:4-amino-4-deoxychorismate lyase